jgi:hypothetical protein
MNTESASRPAGFIAKAASFCIPIIGLVLFFLWRRSKPPAARTTLVCAMTGFIVFSVSGMLLSLFR